MTQDTTSEKTPDDQQLARVEQTQDIVKESGYRNLKVLFPQVTLTPSLEYKEFVVVRQRVLDVIRNNSEQKNTVLEDITAILLEYDQGIPTGGLSAALAIFKLGKKYNETQRKRKLYKKVINSLLEQIFDPALEFKMTKKDILDNFEAHGMERDKVSSQQISQIYVMVLNKIKVGELRDLTWEEDLQRYANLKLYEISLSRYEWEVDGR